MSLPFESLLTLQAYADGELEGTEREAAEDLVRSDDRARAFVESLSVLGHATRAAQSLEPLPHIDVVEAVMREVDVREVAPSIERLKPTNSPAPQVSNLAFERERRAQRSQVAVMIGALAIAAAGILYVRGRHEAETSKPVAQAIQSTPGVASEKGVEVNDIDSNGKSQVSVFYLPASGVNAASSVVVWIDDKGAP